MKRISSAIYVVIILLLVFVGVSFANMNKNQYSEITKKLEFAQPVISAEDSDGYKSIDIKGLNKSSAPGSPELPFRLVKLLIPKGKSVKNVESTTGKKTKITDVRIKPAAPIKSIQEGNKESIADTKIYSSDTLFPGTYNSKPIIQWKSGYQILLVRVYPIQFNPVKKEIEYSTSIDIVVDLNNDSSNSNKFNTNEKENIIKFVDNPEVISSYN